MSAESSPMGAKALRVPMVAKRLDVSVNTVYRLLRSGQLTGRRIGGTKAGWRVTEAALAAFLAAPGRGWAAPYPAWDQSDDVPEDAWRCMSCGRAVVPKALDLCPACLAAEQAKRDRPVP